MLNTYLKKIIACTALFVSWHVAAQTGAMLSSDAGVAAAAIAASGAGVGGSSSSSGGGAAISMQLPSLKMSNRLMSKSRVSGAMGLSPLDQILLESELRDRKGKNEKSEFQKFVAETTGKDLGYFGHDFFKGSLARKLLPDYLQRLGDIGDTSELADGMPVTADYLVAPGDELLIRTWGQVDSDIRVTVDRHGNINLPKVGMVAVSGMKFGELNAYLKKAFGLMYRNFEISVGMGQLRSVTVYVVGYAQKPGTYQLGSMSTAVNALHAAGGPSYRGSMRHVQIKRSGKLIAEVDLYELLLKGDKSKDVVLASGDVIHVPPVGNTLAVTGSVNNEGIFELHGTESSVDEVLSLAGGLATTAEGKRVSVDRIENRQYRRAEQFTLDASGRSKLLKDGDIVTVFSLTPRFENTVTLAGFVANPSRFSWRENMKISDLIPEKEALIGRDYWLRRNFAVLPNNVIQERLLQDTLNKNVLSVIDPTSGEKTMLANNKVESFALDGRVFERRLAVLGGDPAGQQNPNSPSALMSTHKPLPEIQMNYRPEELNWDVATIERLRDDFSYTVIPFNLSKAVNLRDPQHDLMLKPGDIVTVYSKKDLKVSIDKTQRLVRLEGEVVNPGIYPVNSGETLRQLIARAGGLTSQAYLYGAELTRETTRAQQQKQLDEYVQRLERDLERSMTQFAQSATTAEQAAGAQSQVEMQRSLVSKLKRTKATGRIVLEIPAMSYGIADIPDINLEDADKFVVPAKPSTVEVLGSVYSPNAFIFRQGKRLDDYLTQAGGATTDGDGDGVYVLRADGSVVSKRQTSWLSFSGFGGGAVMPGDAIIVPERFDKSTFMKNAKDWTTVLYQFALGVAGLKVLKD